MMNLPAIKVFMSFLLVTVTKEKLTEESNQPTPLGLWFGFPYILSSCCTSSTSETKTIHLSLMGLRTNSVCLGAAQGSDFF